MAKSHLIGDAKAVAVPLVDLAALRRSETRIDIERGKEALREQLAAYGLSSYAEDYVLGVWSENPVILSRIRAHAREVLRPDHMASRLRTDSTLPGLEILRWRYLSLALPAGILLAAAAPAGARPRLRLDLLDPSVAPVGPIAHLHLHVSAASSFEALWTNFMSRSLPSPREFQRAGKLPGRRRSGDSGDSGTIRRDEWLALLTRAALARRVLDAITRQRTPNLELAIQTVFAGACACTEIASALSELSRGRVVEIRGLREARLRKLAVSPAPPPRNADEIWSADAIADGGAWPEGRMIALLIDRHVEEPDSAETRLFLQYLRVKCLLHRLLTHSPADAGLNAFCHTFDQIKVYRAGLKKDVHLAGFALDEPGLDLRAVEVRTAPPDTCREARMMVKQLQCQGRIAGVEVAWVLHFIRDHDSRSAVEKCQRPTLGDAYIHLYRSFQKSAAVLEKALRAAPRELLPTIRALDLAGNERKGPLWLVLPQLKRLRRVSQELAARMTVPPLRLTLHVGEDFSHLATGLRAVHEPFAWGLMERGDRLGHALALGLDSRSWCEKNKVLKKKVTRWERMLDLGWMCAALTQRLPGMSIDSAKHRSQLARMTREMRRHLGAIQLELSPDALVDLFSDVLCDERSVPGALDRVLAPNDPLFLLQLRLRGSKAQQSLLDERIDIETSAEKFLLAELANALANLLRTWQTTVEVNPTSNLLIGRLNSLVEQPLFRLHPLDPRDPRAIPISLNADDPLTFATTLADEYAYTWAALTSDGLPPGYVRHWLDETARVSWRAKFTLTPS